MIDTLVNVKTALQISTSADDPLLTRLMAGADGFITQHTGRIFTGGTFTEIHPSARTMIFLRNYPVVSVASVKVDPARQFGAGTERDPDTYVLHADRGLIESLLGPFLPSRGGRRDDWPGALQVVYTTATNAVPPVIQEAFTQLIGHWYRQIKTFADQQYEMLVERWVGTDAKIWPWGLANGLKIPLGVLDLLATYRMPPTGG